MNTTAIGFSIFAIVFVYSGGAMLLHLWETVLDHADSETGMGNIQFTLQRGSLNGTCPFRNVLTWPLLLANSLAMTLTSNDPMQTAPCMIVMSIVMIIVFGLRLAVTYRIPQYQLEQRIEQDKVNDPMLKAIEKMEDTIKRQAY